ncbi:MAG: sugar ABC transporter substrate-binding protein [Eubacteriales bacterium]|jgi:putative multiple sugar transport system substrate-binding protein|nr:sugar ABC transporter substrate-binding protein [Eubacteriales bacterium]MDD4105775.1 sugar ABC transporter substrate-binding protein [Eubacteriales bacterium]MDD4710755.1 sugar ABC transporter substrate-binding protein [Eubacteriales bacterium]NLO14578.1 sugar ABC transporter substrate-binding protein [Clostridiales bacterium]
MKKILSLFLVMALLLSVGSALAEKVGISMPTKSLQRWNEDGEYLQKEFEAAGYEVELQYAGDNDVPTQIAQLETMLLNECDVLVITAIEANALGNVLATAKENGVKVVCHDRIILDTPAVDYYATFDNFQVGEIQGQYVVDTLDLANGAGPFNIEFLAGDPGDNNATYFFNGGISKVQEYLDNGQLVCVSGQTGFDQVATPSWKTETAQARMDDIIASYYSDGTPLHVVLCSNDSTAQGATNALVAAGFKAGEDYPIITGQDCDIASVKNIVKGLQAMSIFKDTRILAARTVQMVNSVLAGEEVEVNSVVPNNVLDVPTFYCTPLFADVNNYQELLIESGYYTADQLAD